MSGALLSSVARAAGRKLRATSPKLISVTGGVAVGKSTFARKLQRVLMRRHGQRVEVVSTDGFLRSDAVLTEAGIMHRKGFPESFDHEALAAFFQAVRDPEARLSVPVYCHSARGCVGQRELGRPEWLIIEGVYAQQPTRASGHESYAVFLEADQTLIQHWYTERFLRLHGQRFSDRAHAVARAEQLYTEVNYSNYLTCIAPLRSGADYVLYKNSEHMLQAGSGGTMSPIAAFSSLSSSESRSYTDVFGEDGAHHADSIITHHRHHPDTHELGLQHRP